MLKQKKYKLARRLGPALFDKTQTDKFALREARRAPKRAARRGNVTDYGKQLLEKQKIRFAYGISERQLRRYVENAKKNTEESGTALTTSLEARIDNVVYRLGIASSRRAARQMVSHGHVMINGTRTRVPSHPVHEGDLVTVREASKGKALFIRSTDDTNQAAVPPWLSVEADGLSGKVVKKPLVDLTQSPFDPTAVIEFYSR